MSTYKLHSKKTRIVIFSEYYFVKENAWNETSASACSIMFTYSRKV